MKNVRSIVMVVAMSSGLAMAQDGQEGPRGHHAPPAEAISACSGLSSGTACGFTINGHNLTGTCEAPPDGSTIACRPSHSGGPGHTPPKEAITACASSSANATCSFTLGDRTVSGTCQTPPQGSALACRPAGFPGGHHGPPQEAITACASQSASASCSFTINSRSVTGTCATGPDGKTLACRPAGMGEPPAPPPGE